MIKRFLKYMLMLAVVIVLLPLVQPANATSSVERWCDYCGEKTIWCDTCEEKCIECNPGCLDCEMCDECSVWCVYCDNNCLICQDGCLECNYCEECIEPLLCTECGECALHNVGCLECVICTTCYEAYKCSFCDKCLNCGGSACSNCDDSICEDCAEDYLICSECGRCTACTSQHTCTECHLCEDCMEEEMCSECGECTRCVDAKCHGCDTCEDCNEGYICTSCEEACYECSEICDSCGEICIDCADGWCEECGTCSDCAEICEDCGAICDACADAWCESCELCSDCVDLCSDCEEICEDCADGWCADCNRCMDCFDVWCEECETCGDCVDLCSDCEEICADCAKTWCEECNTCDDCVDMCPDCGAICSDCAKLICVDCGACGDCVDLCADCKDICADCSGGWCPECEKCDICVEPCMVCKKTCTDCCDCEEPENQEHKHSLNRVKPVEPTCSQPGNILYYECTDCGKWFEDSAAQNEITDKNSVILTVNHSLGMLIPQADPVHTVNKLKDGMKAHYICSNCKTYFTAQKRETTKESLVIPAPEHEYEPNAYAGKDGHAGVCVCGAVDEVQAHIPGPTATETTDQTCTVCGYIIQVSLNHQHDPEKVPAKDPTCTESGNKEHYVCDCGKIFQDAAGNKEITIVGAITIPPTHSYGDLIEQIPPSHGKDGATDGMLSHYHCPDCGQDFTPEKVPVSKETLTVSASDHEFTDADGDGICDGCKKAENSALEKIESNADPVKPDDPNQGSTSDSGKAEINNTSNGDDKSGIPWWLVLLLALLMTGCGVMIAVFVSKKKAEKE